ETDSGIAVTVVDAAIETDMRTPIAPMPDIKSLVPAPVAGSPIHADGSEHPRARYPVIALIVVPRPITRSPDITGTRTDGLGVHGQRRRPDAHGNENLCEGRR